MADTCHRMVRLSFRRLFYFGFGTISLASFSARSRLYSGRNRFFSLEQLETDQPIDDLFGDSAMYNRSFWFDDIQLETDRNDARYRD